MNRFPDRLMNGSRNFMSGRYAEQSARYRALAETGQKPKTLVIACCDSRAAPETIFDCGPGELFVVRNVANLVPPYEPDSQFHATSAALEFAVQSLKVSDIVVMGHGSCGGVAASLSKSFEGAANGEGGFIGHWVDMLDEARDRIVAELGTGPAAVRALELETVRVSLRNLLTFPQIERRVTAGKLKLKGAYFAIAEGVLYVMDEAGEFAAA